jgi:hypothetical protein
MFKNQTAQWTAQVRARFGFEENVICNYMDAVKKKLN